MNKVELLAPVGNLESLIAAINAGCDAVYLSGTQFGARAFANNFNNEQLKEALDYSHLREVSVYVTVNTLISESDTTNFIKYIDYLYEIGVDALIIQDIGMLSIIKNKYPDFEIHASTQMHIHNVDGIKYCNNLGIKRAVVARESSLQLIKEMNNYNIDLEVFVHGALCVSYSGQCLFSSLHYNRSGNKGECAQPCRMQYDLYENNIKINTDKYLLSTKDLYTLNNLYELLDLNIKSIKIEGRMKKPEYVYQVISMYRKAIDNYYSNKVNTIEEVDIDNLKLLFNRKFTNGYIFNANNLDIINQNRGNHQGKLLGSITNRNNKYITIKLVEDINQHDGIKIISNNKEQGLVLNYLYKDNLLVNKAYKGDIINIKSDGLYVNINDKVYLTNSVVLINNINNIINDNKKYININMNITAKVNELLTLEVNYKHINIKLTSNIVEQSKTISIDKDRIYKQLSKLKETGFKLDILEYNVDDNAYINIKELNELRRNIIKQLENSIINSYNRISNNNDVIYKINDTYEDSIYVNISNEEQYLYLLDKGYILCTSNKLLHSKYPDLIFINNNIINKYDINSNIGVSEVGGLNYNPSIIMPSMNVCNSSSIAYYSSIGVNSICVSYEVSIDELELIVNNYKKKYNVMPNINIVLYSRIKLMSNKYCMINACKGINHNKCNACKNNKYVLKDINDKEYILEVDEDCNNYIYSSEVFDISDNVQKLRAIGIKHFYIELFDENSEKISILFNKI